MKRSFLISIFLVFVMTPAVIQAKEKVLLGNVNFAVKLDYITFTDDFFGQIGDENTGYIGLEGYGKISPNVYLGGEIGTSTVSSDVGFDIIEALLSLEHDVINADFTFFELNVKYAKDLSRYFVIDLGGGLSCNKASVDFETHDWVLVDEVNTHTITNSRNETDWLFGGQIFADLAFKFHWFSTGINGKYQLTEDFKDSRSGYEFPLNNWRLGMQLGVIF